MILMHTSKLFLIRLTFAAYFASCSLAANSIHAADGFPGQELLQYPPVTRVTELPASKLPLQFVANERIAFIGNGLAERMNLFGHFEAYLQLRHADKQLVIRNFARPADEVAIRERPSNYDELDDPMGAFGPDTIFCFFGFNESFAGTEGIADFQKSYKDLIKTTAERYPLNKQGDQVRFVIVGPTAFEDANDPLAPNAEKTNANLREYSAAAAAVAIELNIPFIDLFTPTAGQFASQAGLQWTKNGVHLNDEGYRLVAKTLDEQLFQADAMSIKNNQYEQLLAAINDKSWVHLQDYRMINGWYVYGGRRTWDIETFPHEYNRIRAMAVQRDQAVWAIANGKQPPELSDENLPELIVPPTRFGDPRQAYSEPKELHYNTPDEFMKTTTMPDGFELKLFADETMFPELAKPVQLTFDNKGRLWVACMPTYPQWKPGDGKPDDRILILEDTDGDGRADVCITFYDKLHCPTGFELYNGGVIVTNQPRLCFLKDTDGDDKADVEIDLLDGWGTDDTHHTIGAFEMSPSGLLYMLEGVSMNTAVESEWGAQRWRGAAGAFTLNPQTKKLRRFTTPGYGNPWCMTFDGWGQGVVGDGTNAQQHWATGLSGAQDGPRRGLDPIFNNEGMRPAIGNDYLISRHLPDDVQGQFIYACVINMNGMPRFDVKEDGAAFSGNRIADLLSSTDKNFRPTDPQIGPDGAIWFGDWCNALIGHMQYSQRDPNRDHSRGRIYRMYAKDRPLLEPVIQFGKSNAEVLDQLREYEPRTRYRARRELQERNKAEVVAAVKQWLPTIKTDDPDADRLHLEALWILQRHETIDNDLLQRVLASKTENARAGGIRFVSDMEDRIPEALDIYATFAKDPSPRVRVEVARAISFNKTQRGVEILLTIVEQPQDKWLGYVIEHALGSMESVWGPLYESKQLGELTSSQVKAIEDYLGFARPGIAAAPHINILLNETEVRAQVKRNNSYAALEKLRGNARNGARVFKRVCANCHKVKGEGYTYGPELTDVGRRLSRHDLIESLMEPSAKMDKKFQTEIIMLETDETVTGFIGEETDDEILLLMPEGKTRRISKDEIVGQKTALQSSMPENLGGTISPSEFLDLMDYLASLK